MPPKRGRGMVIKLADTYVYKLLRDGEVVYIGITNDLERRKEEHREDKVFDDMQIIKGPCTREEAEKVESDQLRLFSFFHKHLPEYNQTYNGK